MRKLPTTAALLHGSLFVFFCLSFVGVVDALFIPFISSRAGSIIVLTYIVLFPLSRFVPGIYRHLGWSQERIEFEQIPVPAPLAPPVDAPVPFGDDGGKFFSGCAAVYAMVALGTFFPW